MKTIKYFTLAILFTSICSVFTACDDNKGDTEKPIIDLHAPTEGAVLKTGSHIHFDMDLSDNDELRSYKVDIHSAAGHSHDTKAEASVTIFNKSWPLEGRNAHIHHHEIEIPANAAEGKYHFMVYCTDKSGNESYIVRSIEFAPEGDDGHHD